MLLVQLRGEEQGSGVGKVAPNPKSDAHCVTQKLCVKLASIKRLIDVHISGTDAECTLWLILLTLLGPLVFTKLVFFWQAWMMNQRSESHVLHKHDSKHEHKEHEHKEHKHDSTHEHKKVPHRT
jgi:ABC-type nickel/cobalt efflux system permease component RcnA